MPLSSLSEKTIVALTELFKGKQLNSKETNDTLIREFSRRDEGGLGRLSELAINEMVKKIEEWWNNSQGNLHPFIAELNEEVNQLSPENKTPYRDDIRLLENIKNSLEDEQYTEENKNKLIRLYKLFMGDSSIYGDVHYEGAAMAEYLGIKLILKSHSSVGESEEIYSPPTEGRDSTEEYRPTITLYYTSNDRASHYVLHQVDRESIPHSIEGDGNCLFASIAQACLELKFLNKNHGDTKARRIKQKEKGVGLGLISQEDDAASSAAFASPAPSTSPSSTGLSESFSKLTLRSRDQVKQGAYTTEDRGKHLLRDGDDSSDEEKEAEIIVKKVLLSRYQRPALQHALKTTGIEIQKASDEIHKNFFTTRKKVSLNPAVKSAVSTLEAKDDKTHIQGKICEVYREQSGNKLTKKQFADEVLAKLKEIEIITPLHYALLLQDMAVRLLYSASVSKKYYGLKEKYLKFNMDLLTDEDVEKILTKALENLIIQAISHSIEKKRLSKAKTDKLLNKTTPLLLDSLKKVGSAQYELLKQYFLQHKKHIFKSHISAYSPDDEKILNCLEFIFSMVYKAVNKKEKFIGASPIRHITAIVNKLDKSPTFKTGKGKFSFDEDARFHIQDFLGKLYYSHEAKEAVYAVYTGKRTAITKNQLINAAIEKLDRTKVSEDRSVLVGEFMEELYAMSESYINDKRVLRPTLPNIFTSDQLSIDTETTTLKAEDFFVFIRLAHRSLIRHIKNVALYDSFEGAKFVFGWSFDESFPALLGEKIIDSTELTSNKVVNSKVLYVQKESSYAKIVIKLTEYRDGHEGCTDQKIAEFIYKLMKGSLVYTEYDFSNAFCQFLQTLTYHLFINEVHRHPAAAIHHAMALDLVRNGKKDWSILQELPMSITEAVSVVRGLQTKLAPHSSIGYLYDRSTHDKKGPEYILFQDFINKEQNLLKTWLGFVGEDFQITNDIINKLHNLCYTYFSINTSGVVSGELYDSAEEIAASGCTEQVVVSDLT